ncbi:SAM-dependent methyltransferase [Amycolatopsis sp. H20-H5]|uniref:SAM-dependent methyltransferase n=1 Tax=Amycolatopsis sp. H20-H5 TaxID=3046309 RepID=UPI002DB9DE0C|nr:class I SAM-dependent methyltransferase [Amycolatopsis sp. H20-H5]MEC3982172.1 class I SAM-dependent methyltransferase [Amycolatopsis sp. H20-H5]
MTEQFGAPYWDERYGSRTAVWSGRPNPQLVAETADLTPGKALDVGCGEGGDALWLASNGWQVTGVDFSAAGLRRAADQAGPLGLAERIQWVRADLTDWTPAEQFDLISAQFMHLPAAQREALFARLADAVTPGGTLLIVGHHPSDLKTTLARPIPLDRFFTAEEIADSLDPAQWDVLAADARPRSTQDGEGREITINDAVLFARRKTAG